MCAWASRGGGRSASSTRPPAGCSSRRRCSATRTSPGPWSTCSSTTAAARSASCSTVPATPRSARCCPTGTTRSANPRSSSAAVPCSRTARCASASSRSPPRASARWWTASRPSTSTATSPSSRRSPAGCGCSPGTAGGRRGSWTTRSPRARGGWSRAARTTCSAPAADDVAGGAAPAAPAAVAGVDAARGPLAELSRTGTTDRPRPPAATRGWRRTGRGRWSNDCGSAGAGQRSTVPSMKSCTAWRASSSKYCTGGDFMK